MIKIELIFFLVTINTLHIAHKQTTDRYNATNYLNDLQKRQAKFL